MRKISLYILLILLSCMLFSCGEHECVDEYYGHTREEIEKEYGVADIYKDSYIEYHDGVNITRIHFDEKGIARRTETDEKEGTETKLWTDLPEARPDDFKIYFSSYIGEKNIYDTYTGTLQKDLVFNGTSTAEFSPDEKTLDEIYQMLRECEIDKIEIDMTNDELVKPFGDFYGIGVAPLTHYEIVFVSDGTTYSVKGDATATGYMNVRVDAKNFVEFCNFMSSLMWDAFEEANMPEAEGGYD